MENSYTMLYLVDNRDDVVLSQLLLDVNSFNTEDLLNFEVPNVSARVIENILKYALELT